MAMVSVVLACSQHGDESRMDQITNSHKTIYGQVENEER